MGEEHLAKHPLVLVVRDKAYLATIGCRGVSDDVASWLHFKEVILDLNVNGGVLPGVTSVVSWSVCEITLFGFESDET